MYCHNCGKQIPDGAKFCTGCGAFQLTEQPAAAAAPSQSDWTPPAQPAEDYAPRPERHQGGAHVQSAPKKKRHTGLIVALCAAAAAAALGAFVIAPMMGGNAGSANVLGGGGEPAAEEEERQFNDAYYQLCEPFGYQSPTSPLIVQRGLDDPATAYFATKTEDGIYAFYDYAANGDTVVNYVETVILPLDDLTEEGKAQVDQQMQQSLAEMNAYDFIEATYTYGKWGELTVKCTGLDQAEHSQALYELGVFTEPGPYSLSAIEQNALETGLISMYE